MPLLAGAATRNIDPPPGYQLGGQLYLRPCAGHRDPLEASCLYLHDGQSGVLLVSLDLVAVPIADDWLGRCRREVAARTQIEARDVIISATHTHTAPDVIRLLHDLPPADPDFVDGRLLQGVVDAAARAVQTARPARLGSATGHAHIGYNRRLCWADGTHSMYGDAARADYTGIEGPDDSTHTVLFARDAETNALIAIVHNNNCHTTCIEGDLHSSADFPGEARRLLRQTFAAPELPVLYLQGASGDTSPWPMEVSGPRDHATREARLHEIGACLAAETGRLIRCTRATSDLRIAHVWRELAVDLRGPSPARLAWAAGVNAAGAAASSRWDYVISTCGILKLQALLETRRTETLALHALRLGDLAIVTNPCELYCQFGLDLRRRSPAAHTMVVQLADGFSGYCPTVAGILGGGYSGEAIYWTRLEELAGYRIVDASAGLLNQLFRPEASR